MFVVAGLALVALPFGCGKVDAPGAAVASNDGWTDDDYMRSYAHYRPRQEEAKAKRKACNQAADPIALKELSGEALSDEERDLLAKAFTGACKAAFDAQVDESGKNSGVYFPSKGGCALYKNDVASGNCPEQMKEAFKELSKVPTKNYDYDLKYRTFTK